MTNPALQKDFEKCDRIFVYGTLRQNGGANNLLNGSEYLGTTNIKNFKMLNAGAFPVITEAHKKENKAVVGEVYAIDSMSTLGSLDYYEGYHNSFYDRKVVDTEYGDAWVYFGTDSWLTEVRLDEVIGGNWLADVETPTEETHETTN